MDLAGNLLEPDARVEVLPHRVLVERLDPGHGHAPRTEVVQCMLDQPPTQPLAPQSGIDSQVVDPTDSRFAIHEESDITGHLSGLFVLGHGELAAWRVDISLDVAPLPPPPVAPG